MTEEPDFKPTNQERDPLYNREPGMVIIPGSNYAKEMQKFEQFPSKYGPKPGNPYVYRPFPKMVYKADSYNGKVVCMAAPPDPNEFANPDEYRRAEERARRFTEACQAIARDEREFQTLMERGYRESPTEAVELLEAKMRGRSDAAAERHFRDRNMSEQARAEAAAAEAQVFDEEGAQAGEIPEKPIRRRRGRPPKPAA